MSKGFASNYRIVLVAGLVLLSFGGLGARLFWLHVVDRQVLLDTVEKARREIIIQYARRGDITDVRGNILATSRSLIDLGVDPQLVRREDQRNWPRLAELTGVPLARLTTILTTRTRPAGAQAKAPEASRDGYDFRISTGAAQDGEDDTVTGEADSSGARPIQWAKICDGVPESAYAAIMKLGVRGVYGNRVYRRVYPHNELAAHVVGYVNRGEAPVAGIELFADFYLHGQNGWVESEKDGCQVELAQFRSRQVPASDGYSVVLSIDNVVQHIAEAELALIAQKYHPAKATIIVSDPRTGFLLALANTPGFDLNETGKMHKEDLGRLRNVAVTDMYEPGSVFKIVAASGALNEGLVTPDTRFDCTLSSASVNGIMRPLPREDASDHFDHPLSVAEIIAYSSNKGAAQLGILLGNRKFYDYARAFGFGQVTGFPFVGETPGMLRSPEKWDGLTITRMPMGQGIAVTPLQIHQAMGVIASGGWLLRPQVIREIRDPSGEVVYRLGRAELRRVLSEKTARTMARLLSRVASDSGNAPAAAIPGYDVAGKTGTAQKSAGGHYIEHHHVASFVGFFPAGNPQVEISVIVDDTDEKLLGATAFGVHVAAPSFRHIGEQLIPYLSIQPDLGGAGQPAIAMEGGLP
jgi:cell division protein FtsI/penicillin-binding protein 2